MLDRSLETEFESYRKTLSTDEARRAFDERIERLLNEHGVDYVRGYVDALKDTSSSHVLTLPYDEVLALYFENRRFGSISFSSRAAGY